MELLSRWVIRHRLLVLALWLVVTVAGVAVAPTVSSRLLPGTHTNGSAYAADAQIAAQYGGATSDPGVLVLGLPAGESVTAAAAADQLRAVDAAIAEAAPRLRLVSYASTGAKALVGNGGSSTVVLAYPPHDGDDMATDQVDALTTAAKAAAPSLTVNGTSVRALEAGSTGSGGNSTVTSELIFGAVGALIVLAWVFGSLLAALPIIMALVSVLTMQLLIYGLTYLMPSSSPLNPAVQYIVALLGLGLSIDYSLLVVTRWREERAAGRSNEEAVRAAVRRAGHSVWFSGLVASLGLFALIVVPNSVVRGIGVSGLFIPSTATLVALTLLPAVLSKAGARVDWPRRRSAGAASRFWSWWAGRVIRFRVLAAVLGLGILGTLAGVAATINIGLPTTANLAAGGAYTAGLHALEADGFPSGTLTTVPVYMPHTADAASVAASLNTVASVHGAVAPAGAPWQQDGSAMVFVIPQHEVGTSLGGSSLADIQHTVPRGVLVGGEGALNIDLTRSTYGAFPILFAIVALVTFLLLARGLRSILLPVKAVLLNILSVAASYGLLVLVFQHGFGMQAFWGARSYGAVGTLTPVLIFGFLFGVSMDYEVFILARVREGYERTGSTREGIVEGLSRTGRLVTSAALILFLALASLSTANDITVRQIAAGLACGVLLDAVVVRMLLLPALVSLLGGLNWWMPRGAARLLRIKDETPRPTADGRPGERIPLSIGDAG
ncbi:RND superfamily putative drug exporter [Kitasatospora sp. MAP12-15]|uniref:MMPL family transporter n=1 Tax=unclassified Kitasatospora TaxID=2633591 RepID=UPI002476E5F3|nr:MMPL family transporter [Kitasatospora sp. MAP12-44]MDH6114366.1 RND superfamily putative drug exporter [Kitasatospora sp. MAP12-44]